ncbi:MAG: GGDEF domain-containing protein [Wenzhouxiangella sp.]|nr:MAG: GGDEF domain-containing protein [Wenzhouxiangella sp.]
MLSLLMLDVRTLAFVSSLGGFLMAVTMAGIYFAGLRNRASLAWSAAGLAMGLGYLVGHLLQTVPVPMPAWQAGALANALIGLSYGLILVGVQYYLAYRPWIIPVVVLTLLGLLSSFLFPELRDSLRLRIMVLSGWYIVMLAGAGWLLWRAYRPGMRFYYRAAALVLFAYAGFLLLRMTYAVFSAALTTSFVQDPLQLANFLLSMMFSFSITMALAVMLFREKQVELQQLAQRDPLTGMNNRLSLEQFSRQAMEQARLGGLPLSIMLFDLDHFKQINDRFGHQAGDALLKVVAGRLEQVKRASDTSFRFGGEEFLVLLPGAKAEQAGEVAERYRQILSEEPISLSAETVMLTASFGVVEWDGQESWDDLLGRADKALYQAKHGGRDRVVS